MKKTLAGITRTRARNALTALAGAAQQTGSHECCTYPGNTVCCVPCRHFAKAPCVKLAALIS